MKRKLVALAMCGLALQAAAAECHLKQIEMPVRIVNQRPVATLKLNGVEVPMLVDSGAFFSFLQPSAAQQLNLPLTRLPAHIRLQGCTGDYYSEELRSLWTRTNVSVDQLVADLQAWCRKAEESGNAALREFSLKLRRGYASVEFELCENSLGDWFELFVHYNLF